MSSRTFRRFRLLAIACLLAFAGCTTGSGSGSGEAPVAGPACEKTCDEAFDTCSHGCDMDDLMCPKECRDKLESCTNGCGSRHESARDPDGYAIRISSPSA